MGFFSSIGVMLVNLFSRIGGGILAFISAGAEEIAKNGGRVLVDAAIAGVQSAERTGGSGEVKFNAAWASVVSTLTAEGIPVATNAIRIAIESAVAQLNKGK
jgi:hypothetical protein